jgi:translation initiation factor IF-2
VPQAGDEFMVLTDERRAREIATYRAGQVPQHQAGQAAGRQAGEHVSDMTAGEVKMLPIIVKADVQGSQEALAQSLLKLSTDEVKVQMVYAAWAASASPTSTWRLPPRRSSSASTCVPMPVRASWPRQRRRHALLQHHLRRRGRVKAAMSGMLAPEQREEVIGTAEIRTVFVASKIGTIAGCMVTSGVVTATPFRLLRDNVVIYTGELDSLKRFKDDVKEVKEGFECGIKLKNYNDIKEGDQLEFFEIKEIARTL